MIKKMCLTVLLAAMLFPALNAAVLKPGEKVTVALPVGKAAAGERVIVDFTARYHRPQRIGRDWYMHISVNGKTLDAFMPPSSSGVLRAVNRTVATFHGTEYDYVYKDRWSVASNNSSDEIEHIYCPDDYEQLYRYTLDVTDALQDGENSLVILNDAPGPGKNEKNHQPFIMHLSEVNLAKVRTATLPDPVERSFECAAELGNHDLALGSKEKKIAVKLPARPGFVRVLRCRARLSYGGGGSNTNFGLTVNGTPVSRENSAKQHRMLNRGAFYLGGKEAILYDKGLITVMHGTAFRLRNSNNKSAEARKVAWYYVDIDDMLTAEGGEIGIRNATGTGYFNEERGFKNGNPFLRVYDLAVGYVPQECADLSPARKVESRTFVPGANSFRNRNYTMTIAPDGGVQIEIGNRKFFVENFYSYPKAGFNALVCKGAAPGNPEKEFKGSITRDGNTFTGRFTGKYYTVTRTLTCAENAIHVTEKIDNISGEPLGMFFKVELLSENRADIVRKNGCQLYENDLGSHRYPNGNSSIFWGFRNSAAGIGLIAVNDLFRVQADYRATVSGGGISTRHLGFDSGKSQTLRYSIYCGQSNDYYDFVNAVRLDWKVNDKTIPGAIIWNASHINGNNDTFNKRYDNLGAIGLIDGQKWFNAKEYHEKEFDMAQAFEIHDQWKAAGLVLRPQAKYLLQFQMVFSWRNKDNSPDLMGDSIAVDENGKILEFARAVKGGNPRSTYRSGEIGLFHGYHYPAIGNKYYQYIMDTAKMAMDKGYGGMYFDTPEYAAVIYGRFTYDRWDGATVDLNEDYTIARKYCDLNMLSAEARYNIFDYITKRGGIVVLNSPPFNEKIQQMTAPVLHFSEGDREDRLAQMHFTTPIMLGQHGGSGTALYKGVRTSWRSEEDFMGDIVWKVKNGILYFPYHPPRDVAEKHSWPIGDMYPITVTDIHGGWIRGKERIITVNNGKFGWDEPVKSARIRIYGKNGMMVSDNMVNADSDGKFDIKLPENGMAIIIR